MKKYLLPFTLYSMLTGLSYAISPPIIDYRIALPSHTKLTHVVLTPDLKQEEIQMNNFYGFFIIYVVLVSADLKAKAFKDAKPFVYCGYINLMYRSLYS